MIQMFNGCTIKYYMNHFVFLKLKGKLCLLSDKIFSTLFRRTVSEEAKDILRGLLERKVLSRLGSGPTDANELKKTRYFSVYDFSRINQKLYEAEFRPPISASPTDVRNFDKEFTSEPAADSVVERGHMSETMKEKTKFEAFTFQGENKL